ncbi:hypothetical protein GF374_02930 [Candidatus Woesearchaeota archaeon]|nr:hypothetical protein [Candidatus Woesearchaeota archaeon]
MIDKVLKLVRQKGPVLPVEIATELGVDSFIANAYLSQLIDADKIKISQEPVGNAFLYFMPGQESVAKSRINNLVSKSEKSTKTFRKRDSGSVPAGVEEKRKAFAQRLKEIEEREEKEKEKTVASSSDKEDFLNRIKQAIAPTLSKQQVETIKPQIRVGAETQVSPEKIEIKNITDAKQEQKQPEKPSEKSDEVKKKLPKKKKRKKKKSIFKTTDITELAEEYFREHDAKILEKKIKKKKEIDYVIKVSSGIGSIKMFVKVRDKKRINEADLSLTYTQAQNKKMPALFITRGRLTKTAQNYLKVIRGLLKVRFLVEEEK